MTPGTRWIVWASTLVPIERRKGWRSEWEGEVAYAWKRMSASGSPSAFPILRLHARIFTCVIDALWERKQTMTMTGLFNDLRFAVRGLMRYPTFTAITVLTLALGIGANTAVFTLVDGVLLSPLPFEEADQLVSLEHRGRDGQDELPMSLGLYVLYRQQATSLAEIAMHTSASVNLMSNGEPERIPVQAVTPGFFRLLRVEPAVGRGFTVDEGAPEAEQVVILSDGLWQSAFGRDASRLRVPHARRTALATPARRPCPSTARIVRSRGYRETRDGLERAECRHRAERVDRAPRRDVPRVRGGGISQGSRTHAICATAQGSSRRRCPGDTLDPAGDGRIRAADRMCECRQPPPRARRGSPARACAADRGGRASGARAPVIHE